MLFFFVQAKPTVQDELLGMQEQVEMDLIDFSDFFSGAGKGAADELLIDLECEEPLIDIETDLANLEGFRFQSHLNKEGYLEKSLMDINPPELEKPKFQFGVEELVVRNVDIRNPETIRPRDGSNLRINDNLNELNETRGDGLDFDKPLGIDKIE